MMPELGYYRPETTEDVSTLLQQHQARPFAGATDLLVQMRGGLDHAPSIVDLNTLPELDEIRPAADGSLVIGATVRLSRVSSDTLCARYPALIEGAATVGSVQVRNRATLVGNVCNGSPAADTAPALLVYDARVSLRSSRGRRELPVESFWRGPGQTALEPGEWVESITLPPPDRHGGCYLKLGRTLGMGCAIVGVAAYVSSSEVRIGLASVAPTPLRARRVETEIEGPEGELLPRVTQALQDLISPITDLRASEEYRRAMTVVLLERALRIARARLTVESEGSR